MELSEIFEDLSIGGKFIKFYEQLQYELENYPEKRIAEMRVTLKFIYPDKVEEIDTYDKLKVLYEYSLLV